MSVCQNFIFHRFFHIFPKKIYIQEIIAEQIKVCRYFMEAVQTESGQEGRVPITGIFKIEKYI